MKTRCALLLAILVLVGSDLAGAAKVKSGHDPSFDFSQVKTYRFEVEEGPATEHLDGRIRAEMRAQLAAKGLRELPAGEEQPDVVVAYAVGSADILYQGFVAQPGWYGTLWVVPGGESAVTGGLLIEMGDPETGKLVWAATYVMRGNNANALQVMVKKIEKAVRGAFGKYPPR